MGSDLESVIDLEQTASMVGNVRGHCEWSFLSHLKPQYYPIGGFHRVPATLQSIAESHGAAFHFDSPVESVVTSPDGKVQGVRFADGTIDEADVVVVNADLAWAYNNLFTTGETTTEKKETLLDESAARKLLAKPHS